MRAVQPDPPQNVDTELAALPGCACCAPSAPRGSGSSGSRAADAAAANVLTAAPVRGGDKEANASPATQMGGAAGRQELLVCDVCRASCKGSQGPGWDGGPGEADSACCRRCFRVLELVLLARGTAAQLRRAVRTVGPHAEDLELLKAALQNATAGGDPALGSDAEGQRGTCGPGGGGAAAVSQGLQPGSAEAPARGDGTGGSDTPAPAASPAVAASATAAVHPAGCTAPAAAAASAGEPAAHELGPATAAAAARGLAPIGTPVSAAPVLAAMPPSGADVAGRAAAASAAADVAARSQSVAVPRGSGVATGRAGASAAPEAEGPDAPPADAAHEKSSRVPIKTPKEQKTTSSGHPASDANPVPKGPPGPGAKLAVQVTPNRKAGTKDVICCSVCLVHTCPQGSLRAGRRYCRRCDNIYCRLTSKPKGPIKMRHMRQAFEHLGSGASDTAIEKKVLELASRRTARTDGDVRILIMRYSGRAVPATGCGGGSSLPSSASPGNGLGGGAKPAAPPDGVRSPAGGNRPKPLSACGGAPDVAGGQKRVCSVCLKRGPATWSTYCVECESMRGKLRGKLKSMVGVMKALRAAFAELGGDAGDEAVLRAAGTTLGATGDDRGRGDLAGAAAAASATVGGGVGEAGGGVAVRQAAGAGCSPRALGAASVAAAGSEGRRTGEAGCSSGAAPGGAKFTPCSVCGLRERWKRESYCRDCLQMRAQVGPKGLQGAMHCLRAAHAHLGPTAAPEAVVEWARGMLRKDSDGSDKGKSGEDASRRDEGGPRGRRGGGGEEPAGSMCRVCGVVRRQEKQTYCRPCDNMRGRLGPGSARCMRAAYAELGPGALRTAVQERAQQLLGKPGRASDGGGRVGGGTGAMRDDAERAVCVGGVAVERAPDDGDGAEGDVSEGEAGAEERAPAPSTLGKTSLKDCLRAAKGSGDGAGVQRATEERGGDGSKQGPGAAASGAVDEGGDGAVNKKRARPEDDAGAAPASGVLRRACGGARAAAAQHGAAAPCMARGVGALTMPEALKERDVWRAHLQRSTFAVLHSRIRGIVKVRCSRSMPASQRTQPTAVSPHSIPSGTCACASAHLVGCLLYACSDEKRDAFRHRSTCTAKTSAPGRKRFRFPPSSTTRRACVRAAWRRGGRSPPALCTPRPRRRCG